MIFFLFVSFVGTAILGNAFINVTGSVYDDAHASSEKNWEAEVDDIMIQHEWSQARGESSRLLKILGLTKSEQACQVPSWNSMQQARTNYDELLELYEKKTLEEPECSPCSGECSCSMQILFWKRRTKRRQNSQRFEKEIMTVSALEDQLRALKFINVGKNAMLSAKDKPRENLWAFRSLWEKEKVRGFKKGLMLHDIVDEAINDS